MTDIPATEVMPEAEVSLRLAMHLIASRQAQAKVLVALNGAPVRIGDHHHFDVVAFMAGHGWRQAPLMVRAGIQILTVDPDGGVHGQL